jgi:phenylalanyl-tRNA synthetase beta chain
MCALGFTESINYSFISKRHLDQLGFSDDDFRRNTVGLLNPLSEDQAIMRTTMLPGLLENIRHNINFQQPDLRLFELGKIYLSDEPDLQPEERFYLAAVVSGKRFPDGCPLYFSEMQADFFDLKGAVEALLRDLRLQGVTGEAIGLEPADDQSDPFVDPKQMLVISDGEKRIGCIARISDEITHAFAIKQEVFYAELDLGALNRLERIPNSFVSLPKYPSVTRDIALLVPGNVPAGELIKTIHRFDSDLVETAGIFDEYTGDKVDRGMKSVALSVTYRSKERTLDDETVDTVHDKIVNSLMSTFSGRYREG